MGLARWTRGEEQRLTCRELVDLVTDYLEGALRPPDLRRFEEHLEACEACRAHLEQIRVTIRLLGRLSEETIPPEACDDLLVAFRRWKSGG